jgi:transcriptional regulator with XRE-family HTH domain
VADSLGSALREARRNSGLSFRRFARQAGFSESHLRSVENGHRSVTDDSRQAAWDYIDQDNHPAARRYFETALRASATAGDPVTGAYALSFAAVQC